MGLLQRGRLHLCLLVVGLTAVGIPATASAQAQEGFIPINPTKANKTITLTGEDMTIQDLVDIARHGAKVKIAKKHTKYMNRAYNLIIEAARQGVPVYRFNRGAGPSREIVIFEGDPYEPENLELLQDRRLSAAFNGRWRADRVPYRPYQESEEIVRAMMAVRANNIKYVANGPATAQKIADLLNHRITPLVQTLDTFAGEGMLSQMGNVESVIFGYGEVFYEGERMPASDALDQAGLEPGGVDPDDPADDMGLFRGIYSTNAYSTGEAALLVHEAKQLLDWRDLVFSVATNGLNSSVTPLSAVPQRIERPYPYANWQAERLLAILDDSYLFDLEFEIVNGELEGFPRLLQDPLSFRNYPWRGGSAWKAWDQLRKLVETAMNTSDHNPSTAPGVHPEDSPELQTPWLMRHYVEPTPKNTPYEGWRSEGGFTLSNSNYHQSELANDVEHVTLALASATHQIFLRARRISEPFFSVIEPQDVLSPEELERAAPRNDGVEVLQDLFDELNALIIPVPLDHDYRPEWPDEERTWTSDRIAKARVTVDTALRLTSQELLAGTFWMDVRLAQNPERGFGDAPTCTWEAFREVIPWQMDPEDRPPDPSEIAYEFLRDNDPAECLGDVAEAPTFPKGKGKGKGKRGKH
jgi:histidine ammonia-lyase